MKSSRLFPGMALLWLAVTRSAPRPRRSPGPEHRIDHRQGHRHGREAPGLRQRRHRGDRVGRLQQRRRSFKIPNIPVGTYTVQVTIIGYEDQSVGDVPVDGRAPSTVDLQDQGESRRPSTRSRSWPAAS